jgi:septum formation protein
MNKPILYLGSSSQSRQMLLREAHIPFVVASQSADESACDWTRSLAQVTESIALHKMQHVVLPKGNEGDSCFVLTADTLTEHASGKLEGKPVDRADAMEKLKQSRVGVRTGTAFCLQRRAWRGGSWHVEQQVLKFVDATYVFNVPDDAFDFYFEHVPVLGTGAIAIEGFGNQFLERLDGSYSAVVGLPMYELRRALTELGFSY